MVMHNEEALVHVSHLHWSHRRKTSHHYKVGPSTGNQNYPSFQDSSRRCYLVKDKCSNDNHSIRLLYHCRYITKMKGSVLNRTTEF